MSDLEIVTAFTVDKDAPPPEKKEKKKPDKREEK